MDPAYQILLRSVSIHAPTKGATSRSLAAVKFDMFQSTLPRRERLVSFSAAVSCLSVSIHAPTKGATSERFNQ